MEDRRETAAHPEENCEYYKRMLLRTLARQHQRQVAAFDAYHEGVSQQEGLKLDDERFAGLAKRLDCAEGARVIITHNLHVEAGLMNGDQGVIKAIIFAKGCKPHHSDPAARMPRCLLVDCPKYKGPPFFSEPKRRTWVPIFPRTVRDPVDHSVARSQFPLVLGWALTPWKAQGMTLDKAIVRLRDAVSTPGVLFVALSRVRHPDDLMVVHDFPSLAVILKRKRHPSFQKRQQWEKVMRAKFSKPARTCMQNPELYRNPGTHVWTPDQCAIAKKLFTALRTNTRASDDEICLQAASTVAGGHAQDCLLYTSPSPRDRG